MTDRHRRYVKLWGPTSWSTSLLPQWSCLVSLLFTRSYDWEIIEEQLYLVLYNLLVNKPLSLEKRYLSLVVNQKRILCVREAVIVLDCYYSLLASSLFRGGGGSCLIVLLWMRFCWTKYSSISRFCLSLALASAEMCDVVRLTLIGCLRFS